MRAVALFKRQADNSYRVSLRSKGGVDVRAAALLWGGGGHTNAAGFTVTGDYSTAKTAVVAAISTLLDSGNDHVAESPHCRICMRIAVIAPLPHCLIASLPHC